MKNNSPLISFCVKCYNQERYIGEALAGAFSQTYRPLEIVISDDASSDGSWETITSSVKEYLRRPNAAEVVLNRNPVNLGNLGNWLKICSLAKGELLVKADGDDVSLPERTSRIAEEWVRNGRCATVISHSGHLLGPRGQRMGLMRKVSANAPLGAAMAFHRSIYQMFGDAEDKRMVDDELFAWRARMLGPELVLPDALVRYRIGTGISNSLFGTRAPMCRARYDLMKTLKQLRVDLKKVEGRMSNDNLAGWQARIDEAEGRVTAELMLFTGATFAERREGFRRIGPMRSLNVWNFLRCAHLLPKALGDCLFFAYGVGRYFVRRVKGITGL